MRSGYRVLLAATVLLSAPLLGQGKTKPIDLAALSIVQLDEKVRASDNTAAAICASLIYSDEIARRRPVNSVVGFAAYRRGLCAWRSGQSADALREVQFAEGLSGPEVTLQGRAELDFMMVASAAQEQNWVALDEHALHITARNSPEEFAGLQLEYWRYVMFKAPPASRGKIALAFARAGSFGKLDRRVQGQMAYHAIKPALAEGDTGLAFALATREPSPYSMVSMLIDRAYAPLWPQLEARAGPKLGAELAANLAQAERELAAAPDDLEKLNAVVQAHLWLGQPAVAMALAQKIDHSDKSFATNGEHFGWLVNSEVKALDQLDRRAEADALFERLGVLDPDKERGWLVNFAINRADRLIQQGRWAEALPAAEHAVTVAAQHGSPYAKEVAAVNRYCAAIKLDPARADLAGWWAEIEADRLANIGSAVQAAQCKGDDPAARRFLREGLENEESREQALLLLQSRAADLYRDEGNMFAEPRRLLQVDSGLNALYNKYGRDLPKTFEPTG